MRAKQKKNKDKHLTRVRVRVRRMGGFPRRRRRESISELDGGGRRAAGCLENNRYTPPQAASEYLHKSLAICIVAVLYCRYPHPHPTRHHLTNLRTRASTTTRTCVCHPLPSEQSKRGVERRNHLLAGTFLRTGRSTMFPVATTLLASRFEELHSAVLLMAAWYQAGTPKRQVFYFYILLSSPSR